MANSTLLNYETNSSHQITVQASDGAGGIRTASFTILVTNVAPTTPSDANSAANSIAEGTANGTAVGITAAATDINGPAITYSLTDSAGGRFAIHPTTGVVTVANGTLLNYETSTCHVPTGTLARLAQRIGKVFASASTWYRLVREYQWRRPRQRVHPAAPKVGIRAARPNEIWHIDTSVLRLLDGSRAYLRS